ncbi:MAG: hypothetical protein U1E49_13780 [Hyphomicrobiaceae bacterium]|jgi:hypothetical protein
MASTNPSGDSKTFGSCCRDLNEVLGAEDFEPLVYVGDDGVLYMSVGVVDMEDEDQSGFLDHPVYCCPFCGTRLQTTEEVEAKVGEE